MMPEIQKSTSKHSNNPTKNTPFRPFCKGFEKDLQNLNYAMCCKSVVYEHSLRFCILHFQKIYAYVGATAMPEALRYV